MSTTKNLIPEDRIRYALEELEQILPRAAHAANSVDSVLGFLLNHRMEHVPQFTLLKESLMHYRHLAEVFCPSAKKDIIALLPKTSNLRSSRRRRVGVKA